MDNTEEELKKIDKEIIEFEKRGLEGMLKYFDRVHDKLFTFNTILIAAYLALSHFKDYSKWIIVIPFANMTVILITELLLLEKARLESRRSDSYAKDFLGRYKFQINLINVFSLIAFLATIVISIMFIILF